MTRKIEIEKLKAAHNTLMSSLKEVLPKAHAMFDLTSSPP
ncbi:hypothetical protein CHITON_1308 [Thermococcus chitonophagus]|uniref:Uncharacterized protein n=1 Tax=Thermococcus chitonophagus TaxID=54262 RepID=A0A160VSP5_9EURY|nr:hypothetical protein CHITON_1308 [Thermococcus chitonophagus]